jgi:ADP-heptose:LPS heptosyltransferase
VFAFLSGARSRVGLHRFTSEQPYRGDLMTHRVIYNPYLHVSMQYSLLLETARHAASREPMLKVPPPAPPPPSPIFLPSTGELQAMRERIANWSRGIGFGAVPPRLVLLNPNASDLLPLRKWPTDRFVALGKRILADDPDVLVGITGAPGEQVSADAVCDQIGSPRAQSFAGRTSLRELLTLYSIAEVLITNDSGPAHFASLTPIVAVVLFGPETPHLFGSLAPSTRIIWKALACSPCVSVMNHRFSPCTDNLCMQAITTDEVYAALRDCLDRRDRPVSPSPVTQ